jgi:hypothetical protein
MDRLQCGARVRRVLCSAGLVFGLFPISSALAATTTIGQTGPPLKDTFQAFPAGSEGAQSTINVAGTVVEFQYWSRQQSDCGQPESFAFQVLRPLGGDQYQVVGTTDTLRDGCDGSVDSYVVNPFITVQPGDLLGFFAVTEWHGILSFAGPGIPSTILGGPPQVGDTIELPVHGGGIPGVIVDESATLETSQKVNGTNVPNGNGSLANPSPQSPKGSPNGCDNGNGWKIGAASRC